MFQLIYLSVFSVVFLPQLNCPVIDWCQEKGQISDKKVQKVEHRCAENKLKSLKVAKTDGWIAWWLKGMMVNRLNDCPMFNSHVGW